MSCLVGRADGERVGSAVGFAVLLHATAPTVEYVFTGHWSHATPPVVAWYWPAAQSLHAESPSLSAYLP